MKLGKYLLGIALAASAFGASATTTITGTVDYGGATVGTSCDGQSESQQPVFVLTDGATIKNVVIKAGGGADGIHCTGSCTLSKVVWNDVCEDAATMKGGSGKTMNVSGGTAYYASDKVFQHNGIGSTVNISGFYANTIGKLYRSCGNCSSNGGPRYVNISSTTVANVSASVVGVNSNFGDIAKIRTLKVKGWTKGSPAICVAYKGVQSGSESSKIGEQWGTTACNVSTSDITAY
ncbi:pectate lyase [Uliginosibacterium paludis]|uniref:Pectate lyase n=1 Tax=Uliginosibacterium paludis TaxID=1615952 RepID=A0ABV2CK85_9RHOO